MKINHKKVEQLKSFEGVELKGSETFDELLEIEKEQENKKLIESTIKNILPKNDRSKLINCNGDDFFNKEKKELTLKEKEDNFLDHLGLSRDDLNDDGSDLEKLKELGGFDE